MHISHALRIEFEREMAFTRKFLERTPTEKLAWAPHPRSMTLGVTTGHIAELADWSDVLRHQTFDVATLVAPPPPASTSDLLVQFDAGVTSTCLALTGRTDAELFAVWTVTRGDETLFTMPKLTMLRAVLMNHLIHHRGQLTVYLRLLDVPVPALYGPSADEAMP